MNYTKPGNLKIIIISISMALSLGFKPATEKPADHISIENLARELIINDVQHWIVVTAQGIIEAGWQFNSPLFRQTNNFIGMRIPGRRESMRIGEHKGYSKYATWQDCVKDIKLWQEDSWAGGSMHQYIDLMQNRWAESPNYRKALYSVIKKLEKRFDEMAASQQNSFNKTIIKAYLASK